MTFIIDPFRFAPTANMDDSKLGAYYTFEQTSGNLLNQSLSVDSFGSAADGVNAVAVDQTATGIISNGYDYDGANGTKTTLGTVKSTFNEPLSATAKWSMVFWLNPDTTTANDIIFDSQNASGSNGGMRLRFEGSSGAVSFISTNTTTTTITATGTSTFTIGTGGFHMVAITYDFDLGSNNFKIGLDDGTKESTSDTNAGIGGDPVFDLTLAEAAAGNDNPFDGILDEFSYWERVLTDAEITTLFNSGSAFSIY